MILMDDVLAGISYYLFPHERIFGGDLSRLADFFHKRANQYPSVLGKVEFRDRGISFECEELGQAVSNLSASNYLSSADGGKYAFTNECACSFERRIKPRASAEQLRELEQLAREFAGTMSEAAA